jgi:hypothetical protein
MWHVYHHQSDSVHAWLSTRCCPVLPSQAAAGWRSASDYSKLAASMASESFASSGLHKTLEEESHELEPGVDPLVFKLSKEPAIPDVRVRLSAYPHENY